MNYKIFKSIDTNDYFDLWEVHSKVLRENAELREPVVNQAKEINKLKKEK